MGEPVKCSACGRLASSDLEACPYCREPLAGAPASRPPRATPPIKCASCGRLAAATFTECPFCGATIDGAPPPSDAPRPRPVTVPPLASPAAKAWSLGDSAHLGGQSRAGSVDGHDGDHEDGHLSATTSVVAFALLALAGHGVWEYFRYDPLVGGGQGLGRAAFVVALAVSSLVGPSIVRRYEQEPLRATAGRIGWLRLTLGCAFATLLLAVPSALALYGLATAANAWGTAQTREEVSCVAPSVVRVSAQRRGGLEGRGAAFVVRYACDLRDGVEARGTLALREEPRVRTGGGMKLVASRGLLGLWLRWGGIVPGSETGVAGKSIDDERDGPPTR